MMYRFLLATGFAALAALAAPVRPLAGQEHAPIRGDLVSLTLGHSWRSPQLWGLIRDRHVTVAGLRLETEVRRWTDGTLAYVAEFPLTWVVRKYGHPSQVCEASYYGQACMQDSSAMSTIGIGVAPLGFRAYQGLPEDSWRWFVTAAGGTMLFSGNMPVAHARRANFLAQGGIGLEFSDSDGRRVELGYRYMHMSNAGTAPSNPGLDANVFYMGMTFMRGVRAGPPPTTASR